MQSQVVDKAAKVYGTTRVVKRKISRIDESLCGKFYCKMKNKNEKHFQIPLTYKNNVIK